MEPPRTQLARSAGPPLTLYTGMAASLHDRRHQVEGASRAQGPHEADRLQLSGGVGELGGRGAGGGRRLVSG